MALISKQPRRIAELEWRIHCGSTCLGACHALAYAARACRATEAELSPNTRARYSKSHAKHRETLFHDMLMPVLLGIVGAGAVSANFRWEAQPHDD